MTALISNSELQTFKRCRRKWWLSHWRCLTPVLEKPGGASQLGSRIHVALAAYYTDGSSPVEVFDQLCAADRERYLAAEEPPDLTEFEEDHQLGRVMLEGYLEWLAETGHDEDWATTGAEQQIAVPLFNGEVTFKGKLDVRARRRSDGRRSFRDHKTTGSVQESREEAMRSEQMLGYLLLERLLDPDDAWVESGLYNLLRKVKRTPRARPPFYDRVEAYHSDTELRAYWKRLHGTIIEIMRTRRRLAEGEDPLVACYPSPRRDCRWDCEFLHACPMFDDGSNVEGLLESAYQLHDPYSRYEQATT